MTDRAKSGAVFFGEWLRGMVWPLTVSVGLAASVIAGVNALASGWLDFWLYLDALFGVAVLAIAVDRRRA